MKTFANSGAGTSLALISRSRTRWRWLRLAISLPFDAKVWYSPTRNNIISKYSLRTQSERKNLYRTFTGKVVYVAKREKLREGLRRGKGGRLERIVPPEAERLMRWINASTQPNSSTHNDEVERVTALLEDFRGMVSNREDVDRFMAGGKTRAGVTRNGSERKALIKWEDASREEYDALDKSMNQRLSAYVGSIHFRFMVGTKFQFGIAPEADCQTPVGEWGAVTDLVQLAREGKIGKLLRCERCRAWIYVPLPSGKRSMRFCKSCAAIMRKKYLAAYMQKYRQLPPVKKRGTKQPPRH